METVEIVIRIPKDIYERLDNPFDEMWNHYLVSCGYAIRNGTILPKGHGRLIDAKAFEATMYHEAFETDSDVQKWDSDCWIRYKMFENKMADAPTIIEADGEMTND